MDAQSAPSASRDGLSNFWKQVLDSGEKSDVRFAVGHQYGDAKIFRAHKWILTLHSDVFDRMFNGALPESGEDPIDIPEIMPVAFANMLSFVYTGVVDADDLKSDNLFATIYCADKYNLPRLLECCMNFVSSQLNAGNCLMYLDNIKCWKYACVADVMEKCLLLVDAFSDAILRSDEFSETGVDTLHRILQRSSLSPMKTKFTKLWKSGL
ncbi:BTB/POZ domain-containing protein 1-like isoform X2 [Paramacrobiotus metropolitanus]|nr:BTB/POZ domain-containing protein 1-like isoform X2 [Paramacrobiotus metropolitanus]